MIKDVEIYTVLNSKGSKTIRVSIVTEKDTYSASVPSGTSTGINEAIELPVEKVLEVFPSVKKKLIGMDEDWKRVDETIQKMDGTKNFSKVGGNLAVGLSIAVAKAGLDNNLWQLQSHDRFQFPFPLGNTIGGGEHGGGSTWQEFLAIPYKTKTMSDAVKHFSDFWNHVGSELKKRGVLTGRNIENAWTTTWNDLKILDFLSKFAKDFDMKLGIDFAASNFWDGKNYVYKKLKKKLTTEKQIDFIIETAKKYKLYYLEDPFHEEDFKSFSVLTKKLKKCIVVGDDLYCTNPVLFNQGIKIKAGNSIIIKPNQVGNLSKTQEVIDLARKHKIVPVASHRSGETKDSWLADLALAWKCPLIKAGTGIDFYKYNRLIELWKEIDNPKMAKLP